MSFKNGIVTYNNLESDQAVATSIAPVTVGSTGQSTANPFSFALQKGKRLKIEFDGVFTLGATGGFRFRIDNTATSQVYNAQFQVGQITTPADFTAAIFAEADFANASANAATYSVKIVAFILQEASVDGTVAVQFAQNTSDALPITLKAGATIRLTQF